MNALAEIEQDTPRLPSAGMDAMTRAEIDMQISTAHAYPRSITRVTRNVASLVTMSEQAARECIFSLPRGGKPIVGPSIRLAEILFSQWGNCTGGSRTIEVNRKEGYVEAEGVFHDLETNAKSVRRVRRRILDRNGSVYNDDMIIVTANAAGSIAFRNAVLAGVPRAVWGDAYNSAERVIRGDAKTLPERRDEALKAMAAFGLSAEDVCKIIGVAGAKDITLDQLVVIGGIHNALKEGEVEAEMLLSSAESDEDRKAKSSKEILQSVGKTTPEKKKVETKTDRTPPEPAKAEPDHDPETGEVKEEPKTEPEPDKADDAPAERGKPKENAPDPEQFRGLLNMIKNDLYDVGVAQVTDFYSTQIEQMKAFAPDIYTELMAEFEAYEKAQEQQ